jgi:hypothetical protein
LRLKQKTAAAADKPVVIRHPLVASPQRRRLASVPPSVQKFRLAPDQYRERRSKWICSLVFDLPGPLAYESRVGKQPQRQEQFETIQARPRQQQWLVLQLP